MFDEKWEARRGGRGGWGLLSLGGGGMAGGAGDVGVAVGEERNHQRRLQEGMLQAARIRMCGFRDALCRPRRADFDLGVGL